MAFVKYYDIYLYHSAMVILINCAQCLQTLLQETKGKVVIQNPATTGVEGARESEAAYEV